MSLPGKCDLSNPGDEQGICNSGYYREQYKDYYRRFNLADNVEY